MLRKAVMEKSISGQGVEKGSGGLVLPDLRKKSHLIRNSKAVLTVNQEMAALSNCGYFDPLRGKRRAFAQCLLQICLQLLDLVADLRGFPAVHLLLGCLRLNDMAEFYSFHQ